MTHFRPNIKYTFGMSGSSKHAAIR